MAAAVCLWVRAQDERIRAPLWGEGGIEEKKKIAPVALELHDVRVCCLVKSQRTLWGCFIQKANKIIRDVSNILADGNGEINNDSAARYFDSKKGKTRW